MHKPLDIGRVQGLLRTRGLGRSIHHYPFMASTNRTALENACSGRMKAGEVVSAETQTAGYGRRGSRWHSPAGAGLWFSVILDIPERELHLPAVTLIGATAVIGVLRNLFPAEWVLKWPNDIHANGRKAAGLLAEARSRSGKTRALVLGVGVNVHQTASQFHPEIRDRAVSLTMLAGDTVSREDIFASLLNELERTLRPASEPDIASIRGQEILFRHADGFLHGRLSAWNDDGSAILTSESGETWICNQGEHCEIGPAGR